MSDAQLKLRTIYQEKLPRLFEAVRAEAIRRRLSAPHLLDLDLHAEAYWQEGRRRLVVVGQETRGWLDEKNSEWTKFWSAATPDFELLFEQYRAFDCGKEYYNSPFWRACGELSSGLVRADWTFAWTNLFKMDEGLGRPSEGIQRVLHEHFDVLRDELALAQPHVVVFFTGAPLDWRIDEAHGDHVSFTSIGNRPQRELARVTGPGLPSLTYRTYHPNYLQQQKRWEVIGDLIADARRLAGEPASEQVT